ncbi:MAG: hypothetical protein V4671_09415 [Armatimonadota bacterium]
MGVQINDSNNKSVAASHNSEPWIGGRGREIPGEGFSGLAPLLHLVRPRCPDCGKRGMICRYVVPASYNEPSPRYFQCRHCAARYFRMTTGPWFPAEGQEYAHCYGTDV